MLIPTLLFIIFSYFPNILVGPVDSFWSDNAMKYSIFVKVVQLWPPTKQQLCSKKEVDKSSEKRRRSVGVLPRSRAGSSGQGSETSGKIGVEGGERSRTWRRSLWRRLGRPGSLGGGDQDGREGGDHLAVVTDNRGGGPVRPPAGWPPIQPGDVPNNGQL